eukprot:TRINITY_DN849_c0_g1_i2.p1 TRINITY_DN849_c0_g1~~TRINITY_DN849_c0_g1_i2.p1  ORF type:complete len:150 (-),score=38.98 TRINITY_DN849_c0_g1_i2:34-483(-)
MNLKAIACIIALFWTIGAVKNNVIDPHNLPPCLQEIGYLQDNLQGMLLQLQKGHWLRALAGASVFWPDFQQVVEHCRKEQQFSKNAECNAVLSEFLDFVQKKIVPKGQENPEKITALNFAQTIEKAKDAASYAGRLRKDCRIPTNDPTA